MSSEKKLRNEILQKLDDFLDWLLDSQRIEDHNCHWEAVTILEQAINKVKDLRKEILGDAP